jgi:hypothetical protein
MICGLVQDNDSTWPIPPQTNTKHDYMSDDEDEDMRRENAILYEPENNSKLLELEEDPSDNIGEPVAAPIVTTKISNWEIQGKNIQGGPWCSAWRKVLQVDG